MDPHLLVSLKGVRCSKLSMLLLSAVVLVSSRELWFRKESYLRMSSFPVVVEPGTVWLPGP